MPRWLFVVALVCGCASTRTVRQFDSCKVTEVTQEAESWTAVCVNQWQLLQDVIFHQEIKTGDVVLYVPYKENELGDLHGYIETINGQKE